MFDLGSVILMLNKIEDNIYEVPIGYRPGMRVPGRIFVSEALRGWWSRGR